MDLYQGKWELLPEETTGFDEFTDAIGVPEQAREALKNLVYVVEYTKHGDSWTAKVETVGSNEPKVYSWTPGVEFEYEGLDGMKMKTRPEDRTTDLPLSGLRSIHYTRETVLTCKRSQTRT
ncbi:uncharacterized protein LOC124144850 isoform X4 [Haliotis rufescens]|uniref:uncharacterized protein LOC124144850 isoform X4 n=1 Tax=Haliotis rufescens TaxID=6454 RepID=UPI00201FA063|nr:uncharacterized protein LOC124144850 isoform X4 [Haliotis rufescens]